MVIYRSLTDIPHFDSSVLTIGTFDGIHIGHQTILKSVVKSAGQKDLPSVALTFNPHPQHITKKLTAEKKSLITDIGKKIELIKNTGIEHLVIIPFDENFSKIPAIEFLENDIIKIFHPQKIVIGHDHHFGYQKKGNPVFLKQYSDKYGFDLTIVEPVKSNNQIVNSTHIRRLLLNREIASLNNLLGWQFQLGGTVIHGKGRGRTFGFPTANIKPNDKDQIVPGDGVYCVSVELEQKMYSGVCNIGVRPTFEIESKSIIEIHIFSENINNIYGKTINVIFNKFIREEIKFDEVDMLIEQIKRDKKSCV